MANLTNLARTLAERLLQQRHSHNLGTAYSCIDCVEAVIREAIDKTIEAPILREAIGGISHVHDCPMQYIDGELDPDNCQRCLLEYAIRSGGKEMRPSDFEFLQQELARVDVDLKRMRRIQSDAKWLIKRDSNSGHAGCLIDGVKVLIEAAIDSHYEEYKKLFDQVTSEALKTNAQP